ncbi:MAG: hypothetical protein QNJ77_11640 [Acidimicrobiia bacterium]|nr:hypothetical protein [Acidimicrobiia bacterium]
MARDEELRQKLLEALDRGGRDPLEILDDLETLEAFADDYARARVADARAAGASWSDIAEKLGVTRQAAHKRFGTKKPRQKALELRLVFDRKKQ